VFNGGAIGSSVKASACLLAQHGLDETLRPAIAAAVEESAPFVLHDQPPVREGMGPKRLDLSLGWSRRRRHCQAADQGHALCSVTRSRRRSRRQMPLPGNTVLIGWGIGRRARCKVEGAKGGDTCRRSPGDPAEAAPCAGTKPNLRFAARTASFPKACRDLRFCVRALLRRVLSDDPTVALSLIRIYSRTTPSLRRRP
jgi:hypothetical protein